MELIDRYVYAVTKRLPENNRAEVEKEIRTSIDDMLPENYSENDVRAVLNGLGNPANLADEYRETKRYLIGPSMYESYITTLKLVEEIVVSVVFFAIMISYLVGNIQGADLVEMFTNAIVRVVAGCVEAAIQVFLWVTVAYAIFERTGVEAGQLPFSQKPWSVDKLEQVPPKRPNRIPRGEIIFDILWITLWVVVLVWVPSLFGLYVVEDGRLMVKEPIFDVSVLGSYAPAILTVAVVGLMKALLQLMYRTWNILLASLNMVYHLLAIALFFVMFSNKALFSTGFKAYLISYLHVDPNRFESIWELGLRNFTVVLFLICLADIFKGFWRTWRVQRV